MTVSSFLDYDSFTVPQICFDNRLQLMVLEGFLVRENRKNGDAMVLASVLMTAIHPLIIFKMASVQGGMPLISVLACTV